ncbi:hypothetical protein [Aequorivita lipolytica]|uniref:Uncharacterized protein n=1 Tax=Aequorivita lipolytica TaxID=153267 RepID=A0A5C6YN99_9FLAO|nr:hypothetical protein [Aequorivita lipolytica]TXD69072.1 hypothetical protein ESV24_08475 [Aequorivita lipolytica]SRX51359.1 hypothetical protein AEQU2_01839 [Aequorivita lipolytica]
MNKEETVDLIKGEFTPEEAKEILFSIIGDKIKFNNRQIFSSEERNLGNSERYKKRLEELKCAQTTVSNLIETAKAGNKTIEINAEINIVVY